LSRGTPGLSKLTPLFLMLAWGGCQTRTIAPPPTPAKAIPLQLSIKGAPGPDRGRIILDVVDGPSRVELLHSGKAHASVGGTTASVQYGHSRTICVTPCVADLPHGPHKLKFTLSANERRQGEAFVNIDAKESAYRYALGMKKNNAWKGWVGWPTAVFGVALGVSGIGTGIKKEKTGYIVGGALIGAGLTALGAWLISDSASVVQPGSGVQWHLDKNPVRGPVDVQ